jgi:hypothetical protein
MNDKNEILNIKTRWGEIKEFYYSFNYPINQFHVYSNKMISDNPNIELTIKFENKDGIIRIVNYEALNVSASVSFKKFVRNMKKKTNVLFEDFPKCVDVDEIKFKICSIDYR